MEEAEKEWREAKEAIRIQQELGEVKKVQLEE